jgi:alpha-L-rhamnosidase
MHNTVTKAFLCLLLGILSDAGRAQSPEKVFQDPPESAKPGVLWMWMGSNISKEGITRDLEALKEEGFNRTTMFSLADVTTPWAGEIGNSPTPELVSWTEPWWKLVRHAAEESRRLHMDFGMFNGPGYESSGGTWITPEMSMQEICWSQHRITGGHPISIVLDRPQVDPHADEPYPVFNPETGLVEKPVMEARKTYYKDIAVLALPAEGIVSKDSILDITARMNPDGELDWDPPPGDWIIYRFGHTTMGALIQPAQWKATGLECDKMSQEAVDFHLDYVIGEIQKHLGDLIGNGFTHVHFDSYEAGYPTWTPKMQAEFSKRRGYDPIPWLATFAGRTIGSPQDSLKFQMDFDATIKDLYRDIYFSTIAKKLTAAHLTFLCEPYGGPWRQDEIMPLVQNVMTEFWTHNGVYSPFELDPTVAALRKSGQNIVEAEAFTGDPKDSKWDETPSWLKPMGDAAFCAGVNRFILHRFVQQPWDIRYLPGATMGQWGTHFDRTQTWWKPGKAMVKYWQRCQALLQWGRIAEKTDSDFIVTPVGKDQSGLGGNISIKAIHRRHDSTDIYFVANLSHNTGAGICYFKIGGMQPELWDPVTGSIRLLSQFEDRNGQISLSLSFEDAQSFFIVFRHKATVQPGSAKKGNFSSRKEILAINGSWQVKFDTTWGGPPRSVTFASLQDWTTRPEKGIRYFSGTAVYRKSFDLSATSLPAAGSDLYLDLGTVKHLVHIFLNGKDLGVLWTAPWSIRIPAGLLKAKGNRLTIEVTNVWANRLIGDEQEPADCEWLPGHMGGGSFLKAFPDWFLQNKPRPSKGRYCFTTWNYFTKDSPLVPSGLMGPVKIMKDL